MVSTVMGSIFGTFVALVKNIVELNIPGLKVFAFVSLKNFKSSLFYAARLSVPFLLLDVASAFTGVLFLLLITKFLLALSFVLITRPSVEKKDLSYKLLYFKNISYLAVLVFLPLLFLSVLLFSFENVLSFYWASFFGLIFFMPLITFSTLLFLDSEISIFNVFYSLWRGARIFAMVLPASLALGCLGVFALKIAQAGLIFSIVSTVILLFFFSISSIVYTKIKYQNFSLFF